MIIKTTIKAGIIGGAGYTGGELLRILINHPNVEIAFIHSNSNAGNLVTAIHSDLLGETDLTFSSSYKTTLKSQDFEGLDVLFLCVGHGDAVKFLMANNVPAGVKIIDLSQDFRLHPNADFNSETPETAPKSFVYGLPELNREQIKAAQNIANPGCFATCIQLGLLPLAQKGHLKAEIHINATTGSTGAGQSLSETSHFTWRNNNLSVYKAFNHQHLGEIKQSLSAISGQTDFKINFIPERGDFTRGILAAMYLDYEHDLETAFKSYESFYHDHPFTFISRKNISLKQVINTNKCFIHLIKEEDKLLIISIIDNLLKGASGQAVQNMNLMFGFEETTGLKLKPSAF